MIGRVFLLATQLGVLGLGAYALWAGPLQAPFFSADARAAVPVLDGAPPVPLRTQFDPKNFHVTQSWVWLASLQNADEATQKAGAEALVGHARRALEAGPASGYAWLALAWGEHMAGRDGSATEALQASWRWAPESRNLAWPRVLLGSRYWLELGPDSRGLILKEMYRARATHPDEFRDELALNPRFAAMLRLAGITNRAARLAEQEQN